MAAAACLLALPGAAEENATAFCRFVPERMDDFAWENDRVAFRVYGPKLWEDPAKRCSSGIDVWVKKVRYPIINKWMKEKLKGSKYHDDTGEGADLYKVGKTLGCGGLGFWVKDALVVNRHFAGHRVIQGSGPWIEFELTYAPLDVDGRTVTETKRVRMETGGNLFEVRNSFAIQGGGSVMTAVGIVREGKGEEVHHGDNWLAYAGLPHPKDGQTFCAVVLPGPAEFRTTSDHVLMLTPVKDGETFVYRAGAGWSKGLDFQTSAQWTDYVKSSATPKHAGKTIAPAKSSAPPTPEKPHVGPAAPAKAISSLHFRDWPAGTSPVEVGKRVAENFLSRGHYQDHKELRYPDVITWFGSFQIAKETGDKELAERLIRRYDTYLKNPKLVAEKHHVDYAVLGIVPLEIHSLNKDPKFLKLGMMRADGQWVKPTEDGLTSQARYWVDDIYMIAAIQTAAYRTIKDPKYLDRAALTATTYLKKLQKDNGLFWHAEDSPYVWGRGAGWYAAGMTEILKFLPANHPQREVILAGYRKTAAALLKHQAPSGLWRQLVDKPESWEETSGSGMFAYAMINGVRRGWLDEATYGPVARKAWLALVGKLDEQGNLHDVCVGTNKAAKEVGPDLATQLQFYLDRPRVTGDYHGQAPLLWCATALMENIPD